MSSYEKQMDDPNTSHNSPSASFDSKGKELLLGDEIPFMVQTVRLRAVTFSSFPKTHRRENGGVTSSNANVERMAFLE